MPLFLPCIYPNHHDLILLKTHYGISIFHFGNLPLRSASAYRAISYGWKSWNRCGYCWHSRHYPLWYWSVRWCLEAVRHHPSCLHTWHHRANRLRYWFWIWYGSSTMTHRNLSNGCLRASMNNRYCRNAVWPMPSAIRQFYSDYPAYWIADQWRGRAWFHQKWSLYDAVRISRFGGWASGR